MRHITILLALYFSLFINVVAQNSFLPATQLETLDGKMVNSSEILSSDTISIIVFWSPDLSRSLDQIELMLQTIEDSLHTHPVKTIAIAVAEPGKTALIKPLLMSRFDHISCLFDKNKELTRLLAINEFPYTILVNQEGKIICRRPGFCLGADVLLCKEIKSCLLMSK